MNGFVKFFNNAKGWGIIEGWDRRSYFCHHSNIADEKFLPDRFRTLKTGEQVSFQIGDTLKPGLMPNALSISIVSEVPWQISMD